MSYTAGAASGAAQGAAAGAAFGPWGAAIGAVVGAVSSVLSQKGAAKAQEAQLNAAIEASRSRNKLLMQEAARGTSEINRQRTISYIQTAQALQHLQQQESAAQAESNVALAVTERIGNTVTAIKSDIDHKADDAESQIWLNNEIQQTNLNVSLESMLNNARSQFTPVGGEYRPIGSTWGQALVSIAGSAATYKANGGSFDVFKRDGAAAPIVKGN